jgi:hypothetical protein
MHVNKIWQHLTYELMPSDSPKIMGAIVFMQIGVLTHTDTLPMLQLPCILRLKANGNMCLCGGLA